MSFEEQGLLAAHDYKRLVRRWRAVARAGGLRMRPFAQADGYPVFVVETKVRTGPGLYLSAGIHGDEPAATEALVSWAEGARDALGSRAITIFPCLNPWGLLANSRFNSTGRDLNRCYDKPGPPVVAAHRAWLKGREFALALALHEDYDARGAYVYEIRGVRPHLAERLLEAAVPHAGRETRRRVEGSICRAGVIRRSIEGERLSGHPEAFFLHRACARRVLTLETPSEIGIGRRVAAHVAAIEEAVRILDELP